MVYSPSHIVIDQQAGNRQTTINQLRLCELIDKNLLNQIAVSEVKTNIAIGNGGIRFHFNELLPPGLYILSPTPLVLLFAKLFITLKLCLFIFFYRSPSFTRLNALDFFRRSLDLRRFLLVTNPALSNCSCKVSFAIFVSKPAE